MLQQSFIHLPGVGERTERVIWKAGVRDWLGFMSASSIAGLSPLRMGMARSRVLESIQRYEAGDWLFFEHALPAAHRWRAYGTFPEQTLYVDIETDGGMGPHSITVIGTFDGSETRAFVRDRNLDEALPYLSAFPVLVSFNGARFDMPLIRSRFPARLFNHVHIDLLYPLHRLGLRGGLKRVEQALGIRRSSETEGLGGWDAVRLWQEYEHGSSDALNLLLRYNQEDVRHLEPLMKCAYERLAHLYRPDAEENG